MRGQVFRVDLGHGAKPWLVVSNNARNSRLDSVIAARITTTTKRAHLPTVVALEPTDPLVGAVLVDDLVPLYQEELILGLGSLTPRTMSQVSAALRIALP